ncbi:hypothetical protein [Halapricum desulfuricans]|uniref:Uncharacterized protein n=1 Tax=Halapricum desulfuricans TaxID=2841257 RepID=A0A897NWX1_9EURY|nr:hypothetical protein [Halapricum desulfuricans]QSG14616.1 hypothetical protein HSEST_1082 [Halapricum desulfuricans]
MAEFTLLEIHLDDASIDSYADGVAALPFSSISLDDEYDRGDDELDALETDGSSGFPWKAIALVAVLTLTAVLAYKRLAGG